MWKLVTITFIAALLSGCTAVNELAYDSLVDHQIEKDRENSKQTDYEKKKNYPSYEEYLEERKATQDAIKKGTNK